MVKYDENLLKQEQKNIDDICLEIGKKYVAEHKDSPDPAYAQLMGEIAACEQRIADHKTAVLKENGLQICPECGEEIPLRSFFCNICGTKLSGEQPAAAPVEEPVAEEPVMEEPVIEEPAVEEPVVEEPAGFWQDETDETAPAAGICASCGAPLEPDCLFCMECGTRVESPSAPATAESMPARFCTVCGFKVTDNEAMFCNSCGARLEAPAETAPAGKTCPNCGFRTDEADVLFCIDCGTRLK